MEDVLSLENILDADEVENLFSEEEQDVEPVKKDDEEIKKEETTEVLDVGKLFTDEKPESVGGGNEDKDEEDTDSNKGGSSPKNNFYSSIAIALKEEGIFPDLDEETLKNIKAPEDFAETVEKQIQSKFDERQRRVDEALNADIEVSDIKKFENTISYLDSIEEDRLTNESDEGEQLRKQLIYQDFINRGYTKERATREVQKSINGGTDIEDAKEALSSNKEFFNKSYNDLVNEAKEQQKKEEQERKEQAAKLKKSLLEDNTAFGEIKLDKVTRQKIYENISKPIHKDPETGELLTAIQKYEMENKTEFIKNLGLLFTLTDGFKNLDALVKGRVKTEVKKGLRELENTLNNTARTSDGNIKFVSGVGDDPESFIGKDWDLDV